MGNTKKRFDGQQESAYYRSERRTRANELGKIPKCKNEKRRERARKNFCAFCTTYFPQTFFREFQSVHSHIASDGAETVQNGGKRIVLAPRRTGKTALLRALILWAILCHPDRHKYVLYVGSVADATRRTYDWILDQFRVNDKLVEDFPEVCVPVRAYGGNPQKRLTYNGDLVNFKWSGDRIQLPTIANSPYSGITIRFVSISSGSILGTDVTINGVAYRPSFVAIDDVMSQETARSPVYVKRILGVIRQGIADLAGYDPKTGKPMEITIFSVMTAREEADVAMQLLNDPDYIGIRYRRLDPMPARMDLWTQYRIKRNISFNEAKKYYAENREEMDREAIAIDNTDFADKYLSAIHSAMDIWSIDPSRFFTEQQNDPQSAYHAENASLTPTTVASRIVDKPPLQVPQWAEFLTAFIDVGEHYLNWEIVAFGDSYRQIRTIGFGWFPDQGTADITKHHYVFDIQSDYADVGRTPGDRVSAAIHECLDSLLTMPFSSEYDEPFNVEISSDYRHFRTSEQFPFLSAIGVDSGDGELVLPVWAACDAFNATHGPLAIPCNGSTAQHRLIRNIPLNYADGEWSEGMQNAHRDWVENASHTQENRTRFGNVTRSIWWDVNLWKTRRNTAWMANPKSDGSHKIVCYPDDYIKRYAEHQCAEESVVVSLASMREYRRWKMKKPQVSDNEFLDTNTGCWMLADYVGMRERVDSSTVPTCVSLSREEIEQRFRDRGRR